MRTIYRYTVPVDDQPHGFYMQPAVEGELPFTVANSARDEVEFWAEVETNSTVRRRFQVFGTGHAIPDGARYAGTAPRNAIGLVWHLYEVS